MEEDEDRPLLDASSLREGTRKRGWAGKLFEVKGGKWVQVPPWVFKEMGERK